MIHTTDHGAAMAQSIEVRADAPALFDLDPRVLIAVLGHNTVDHELMRGMFALALVTGLRELNQAVAQHDWAEARQVAAFLGASAMAIGAQRLAWAMAQLEDAAIANQTAALLALHSDLPRLVSAFEAARTSVH